MALISGSNALNTEFGPVTGDFWALSSGVAELQVSGTSGGTYVSIGPIPNTGLIVRNPAAMYFKWQSNGIATPTVGAYQ